MCHAYALCDAYNLQGRGWLTVWMILYSSKLGFRHRGYNIWEHPDPNLEVYKTAGAKDEHFELARKVVNVLLKKGYDISYHGQLAMVIADAVELDCWSQNRKPAWMTFFLSYSTALLPMARILYEQTRSYASFADIWPIARTMSRSLARSFEGCRGGMLTRPSHALLTRG